jgi:hypothetical protein
MFKLEDLILRSSHLISLFVAVAAAGLFTTEGAWAATSKARSGCQRGMPACPIEIQMARGSDTITVKGVLSPERNCCAYALRMRAGQVMTWDVDGPAVVSGIRYPNGQVKAGLPASIRLPQSGVYLFGVLPNDKAERAFGEFELTFTVR